MKDTARAAAQLGVDAVTGFTGSPIWHMLYSFPPNDFAAIERGYEEFAERWGPIIDVFDAEGVRFALEVHPTEIAYDFVTTRKALAAIGDREAFGINFDPSHFAHQFLDSAPFVTEFADRIYHVHVKDSQGRLDGRRSILGSHLNFGEPGRGWDFVSPGPRRRRLRGAVPRAEPDRLRRARSRSSGRTSGMDREWGAPDALAFVRRTDFVAVGGRLRRCVREGGLMSERRLRRWAAPATGADVRRDRGRHARLRVHGQGALERATRTLAVHDVAAAAACRSWWRSRAATRRPCAEAARRYGFERYVTDWRDAASPTPDVELFDNVGPEQPARRADGRRRGGRQARDLREAARARPPTRATRCGSASRPPGVKHMMRVQLPVRPGGAARARDASRPASSARSTTSAAATCRSGGRRRETPGASTRSSPGSGALGDLGAHVIDLARYLVGEIATVARRSTRDVHAGPRGRRRVRGGGRRSRAARVGTIEASRFAPGRKNALQLGDQRLARARSRSTSSG